MRYFKALYRQSKNIPIVRSIVMGVNGEMLLKESLSTEKVYDSNDRR